MRIKLTHITPLLAAGAAACSDRRRTDGRGRSHPAPEDLRRDRRGKHVPVARQC